MTKNTWNATVMLIGAALLFTQCRKDDTSIVLPPLPLDNATVIKKYLTLDFDNLPNYAALVAFLNTLTDQALLEDVKFADPFK